MMNIQELIEKWDRPEGHPYKGSLIDMKAWRETQDICAMCAQGQVLHLVGGMSADDIHNIAQQAKADRLTADLLKISRAHAVLLRSVNDKMDGAPAIVLTDPGKVLGGQWSNLLNFWWHLDQMTPADWRKVDAARDAAWDAARDAAWDAARDAAWAAARDAAGDAAGDAAWDAAGAAAGVAAGAAAGVAAGAAAGASNEIQGAALMRERGKPFFFLPMFGFASPGAIPARPAEYGAA